MVDTGCPAPPTITDSRYNANYRSGAPTQSTTPSRYRLFVFVAPSDQLAQAFPRQPKTRETPQEVLCTGHACVEVTTAVYLTPEELTNQPVLLRALVRGVGLWPVGERRFDPKPMPPNPNPPGR